MNDIILHKYGGTSVGNLDCIKNVARRIKKWIQQKYKLVIVVSAMSGETDNLLKLAHSFNNENPNVSLNESLENEEFNKKIDFVCSTGEQVSCGLLGLALQNIGVKTLCLNGWQVPILTDSCYSKARIQSIDGKKIINFLDSYDTIIVTGFQGVDSYNNITTMGRGGSDTSAVALAVALQAKECFIYTDVDGVFTTDPRIEPSAKLLKNIYFEEMLEMASLGAKVLQIRSVEFASKYKMPLRVLSSFTPWDIPVEEEFKLGTLITYESEEIMENAVVSGIAFNKDEARITLVSVDDKPGVASNILKQIANANIDVDMIIQNLSLDNKTDFTFTVHRNDYEKAINILESTLEQGKDYKEIKGDNKICKVSIVGIGMRNHSGVAQTMFNALREESINIKLISTSEIKTSVVIDEKYLELAVRALHKAFNLDA